VAWLPLATRKDRRKEKGYTGKDAGPSIFEQRRMAGYIIDIWKDDELVQSVAG